MNRKTVVEKWNVELPDGARPLAVTVYQLFPERVFEAHVEQGGREVDSMRADSVEHLRDLVFTRYGGSSHP